MTPLRFLALLPAIAALVGLNVYLYRRLVRDVTATRWARWAGGATIFGLLVLVPLSRLLLRDVLPARWLSLAVMSWWGFTIFTLLAMMTIDLARLAWRGLRARASASVPAPASVPALAGGAAGVHLASEGTLGLGPELALAAPPPAAAERPAAADDGSLSRRLFLARASAAGALVAGGGISTFGAWRAFAPPEVTEVPLRLAGLPRALDGFTIVQLSDLHIGAVLQERFVDQLVAVANGAKPDLVAITGDLVDGSPGQLGRYVARLKNLQARHGIHFVSGNHDYYSGWERWAPQLSGLGFNVLRNRLVSIGDAGASFDLVGVEDWGFGGGGQYDLEAATAGRDPDRASVLMAHQPKGLELAAGKRLGLQLSGHTHGGQLFPGTLVGEVIWGDRNAGLSRYEDTHLYTSRGCGFVGPPMRVGAPPEVVKVVLLAG
jgi:predicted MPP superfamily phosphohydrolase